MPSLGSVSEGMLGTQLDLQNIQLNRFKIEEAPIKIQQAQVELQKDQIDLSRQVKMLSLMQNIKPPADANTPEGMANVLLQWANIESQSGMPDAAGKLAGEASRIMDTSSKVDSRSYRIQNDRLSKLANVMDSQPDTQQGFMSALAEMATEDPGVMKDQKFQSLVKMAQQPPGAPGGWHPGLAQEVKRGVLTVKDQATVDYRNVQEQKAKVEMELDELRKPLIQAQTALARERETKLTKEGVLAVKASQLKTITDKVKIDYPGASDEDVRNRSRPLAEEMVRIMKEKHLTESEAATKVYEANKKSFTGMRQAPKLPGTKPETPRDLPKRDSTTTLEEYKKKLTQNQWYTIGGEPKLLLGNKFYSQEELEEMEAEDKVSAGLDEE